jgi:hypothetical protein
MRYLIASEYRKNHHTPLLSYRAYAISKPPILHVLFTQPVGRPIAQSEATKSLLPGSLHVH